jgi:predicted outer membrane repeat protein
VNYGNGGSIYTDYLNVIINSSFQNSTSKISGGAIYQSYIDNFIRYTSIVRSNFSQN